MQKKRESFNSDREYAEYLEQQFLRILNYSYLTRKELVDYKTELSDIKEIARRALYTLP
jgi:hypothetical protein